MKHCFQNLIIVHHITQFLSQWWHHIAGNNRRYKTCISYPYIRCQNFKPINEKDLFYHNNIATTSSSAHTHKRSKLFTLLLDSSRIVFAPSIVWLRRNRAQHTHHRAWFGVQPDTRQGAVTVVLFNAFILHWLQHQRSAFGQTPHNTQFLETECTQSAVSTNSIFSI